MPSTRVPAQLRIAILGIALAACTHRTPVPDGDVAASLTAKAIGEYAFDPAMLHGKPAVVLFVTPTCPHCQALLPIAARAAATAAIPVVAVFIAGKAQNATDVLAFAKFTGAALIDDDGALRTRYAITRVPYTLVLGADGHARTALIGEQDEATLAAAIADAR
jgi:thiol-disulfide isomerase/thioredoxin